MLVPIPFDGLRTPVCRHRRARLPRLSRRMPDMEAMVRESGMAPLCISGG
jgi:hypothetical protein